MNYLKLFILSVPLSLMLGCGGGSSSSSDSSSLPSDGTGNTTPIANAGQDQRVKTSSVVYLDGNTSSDADGDSLTYSWSFTSLPTGSQAVLSDATSPTPTFTADTNGRYILSLTVNDGVNTSNADTVEIAAATNDFGPLDQSLIDTNTTCDPASGTVIAGGNIINQVWNAAGSPYIIEGDVTIPSGASLTIEKGTTVCFASTDAMASGLDTTKVEVINNGDLNVSGTPSEPVIFRSVDISSNGGLWYGVIGYSTSTNINDTYVTNAAVGVYGSATVSNSVFMNNLAAVSLGYNSVVDASVFIKNQYGVRATSTVFISNILASENTYAIFINTANILTIKNSTLDNNIYGVYVSSYGYSGNSTIIDSIITNNKSYGIYLGSTSYAVYLSYSDVWNNNTYGSNIFGTNNISSNPLFVDNPFYYSLSVGSPAIDSGTDSLLTTDIVGTVRPQDGDGINGAAFDMGAYEIVASPQ